MSTLFNRKDTSVIEFALNNDLQAFLKQYGTTSATPETLTKAFNEINGNKTKSNIAIQSGDGKPNEPLVPIDDKAYKLGKDGEIEVPKSLKLEKGKVVKVTPNPDPVQPTSNEKITKPKAEKAKVEKVKSTTDGKPSKRDAIKAYLQTKGNADKSNKEIKQAMLDLGYPSCYDSEISAVKAKM